MLVHNVIRESLDDIKSKCSTAEFDRFFWRYRKITLEYGNSLLGSENVNRLEELRARQACRQRIAEMQVDGKLYIVIDSTDCDHSRSTSRHVIPATLDSYSAFLDRLYNEAEGPTFAAIVSKDEYDNFVQSRRDLALEAFEDGHPHVIFN